MDGGAILPMSVPFGPISPGAQIIVWGLYASSGMTILSTFPTHLLLREHRDLFLGHSSSPASAPTPPSNKHTIILAFCFQVQIHFIGSRTNLSIALKHNL